MRIIGGQHRGIVLAAVGQGDAAAHLRPTPDRVRESLFNILAGYNLPYGARVLDLFAGTGALGLEALSRGAAHVTFVDNGRAAQKLIHDNIAKLKRSADTALLKVDATRLSLADAAATLIFLDPPYGAGLGELALQAARETQWIAAGAVIVWEDSVPHHPPPGFELLDQRRYASTWITILRAPS